MEKSIIAFISLGFGCGGPEEGEYGEFTVDLSDDEIKAIDEVVKTKTTVYKRNLLKKRYPELDKKIVDAARGLVRDVLVNYPELDEDLTDADLEAMSSMTYHERADYLVHRHCNPGERRRGECGADDMGKCRAGI